MYSEYVDDGLRKKKVQSSITSDPVACFTFGRLIIVWQIRQYYPALINGSGRR